MNNKGKKNMKNIINLIVLLIISLSFIACEEKEKRYADPENTRKAYLKHKEEAKKDLLKHSNIYPPKERDNELRQMGINNLWYQVVQHGKPEAGTDIALAYYQTLHDYEKTLEWLEYSNSIKPTAYNSNIACAVYLEKEFDKKEAIKWCKQAVDLGLEDAITGLGIAYSNIKDYENAIYWLKKGDELKVKKSTTNLGYVYNEMGNLEEAYKYYKKAVKDDPKDSLAVNNLIHFYHDDLKDNVKASAWAIAGTGNVFSYASVSNLLSHKLKIPFEDIVKGRELQLTSDEFPYKNNENLSIFTQREYDDVIEYIDKRVKSGFYDENYNLK